MITTTVKEWLVTTSEAKSTSEEDDAMMRILLHRVGFPQAVVTCGIVYLEGHGTMEAPPCGITQVAKMLLKTG